MNRERNRPQRPPEERFDDESLLQDYLARLMTMQDQREDWLEEADLKTAAKELGLSDKDLERLAATTEAHRTRGRSFIERGLWDEAVEEYRQAATLNPFDIEATHELATAYRGRWHVTGDEADRAAAERYTHRTLQLDPQHSASYTVLQELKRRPVRTGGPTRAEVNLSRTLVVATVVGLILLALLAFFII
jgi:tetratricopeptide (TPR) repeat protein